jgi:Opioid growth factor receptor (OGFr) conserved region
MQCPLILYQLWRYFVRLLEILLEYSRCEFGELEAKWVPINLHGVDSEGRKLAEIWAWDFEELECAHDYIQWLFPLMEVSAFNPDAPLVNEETDAAAA